MAEPAIGVTFHGTDAAVWGGEFLVGGLHNYRRAGHLRYLPMPGGDQVSREPWRMAAYLGDAGEGSTRPGARGLHPGLGTVRTMLARRINAPPTSGVGRLFDARAGVTAV